MLRRIAMAALVASALLIGLSPQSQSQEKSSGVMLTADELKKLFEPYLLITGRDVYLGVWFANLFARGGILYDMWTGDTVNDGSDKGTWRLDGDKVCGIPHSNVREHCKHWYRLADGSYEARNVPGEQLESTFRIVNKP